MNITKDNQQQLLIDINLVHHLITTQFPQWKNLTIRPVAAGGWDNRTFQLGEQLLIRLPSAAEYAPQVEKEQQWLPRLAPLLPLSIPKPIELGKPGCGYPWQWSVYRWLKGNPLATDQPANLANIAENIAKFLIALHNIDTTGGPLPEKHNFYRGGSLTTYDAQMRQAITILSNKIDTNLVTEVWEAALSTQWLKQAVWVHGDLSKGNMLVQDGQLSAIIDFGLLAIGDPACDLAITWTLFHGESREILRNLLPLDKGTWMRGRGWTLWKAIIIAADLTQSNATEAAQCWRIIEEVLTDYKKAK